MSTKETRASITCDGTRGQGAESQNEGCITCAWAVHSNPPAGDGQVSTIVIRDGQSLTVRRTVGHWNVRHLSFSLLAESRQSCTSRFLDGAKAPGDGDVVGQVHRSMRRLIRDASNNRLRDRQSFFQLEGNSAGKANPAWFFNTQRNLRGAVHVDEFHVLANRSAVDHIGNGKHRSRKAAASNRIIVLCRSSQIHDILHSSRSRLGLDC